jgi:hypothetical protein
MQATEDFGLVYTLSKKLGHSDITSSIYMEYRKGVVNVRELPRQETPVAGATSRPIRENLNSKRFSTPSFAGIQTRPPIVPAFRLQWRRQMEPGL